MRMPYNGAQINQINCIQAVCTHEEPERIGFRLTFSSLNKILVLPLRASLEILKF